ncbi:MAG: hypothetical protein PHI22_00895 [Bacilli bacterium]|nr:hypothetical protein [Bacilli bacterium]MDD4298136.1 hypothetical protein [Bacilli bacterium]MDD4643493.1 hypothetical protein [Bacilli bacterium]
MKLIDKIRNYFYDEEEDVSKKDMPIKNEASPIETDYNSKERKETSKSSESEIDEISERELFKSDPTFNFPIIFDDEDYKEKKSQTSRITVIEREHTKIEEIEKRVFKPSPNISPVFGVIEPSTNTEKANNNDNLLNLYDENKKVDIDDILGKVYNQTRVEIKKENYTGVKVEPVEPEETDFSIDFFNNNELDSLQDTTNDASIGEEITDSIDEQLRTIDELLENTNEEDFYSLVDSMYKDEDKEGEN